MIKKIIFDIDNTLIEWKYEYNLGIEYALKKLNIEYDDKLLNDLIIAQNNYDNIHSLYNKDVMIKYLSKVAKIDLPDNFIDEWFEYLKTCVPKELGKEKTETLEYLCNKYTLAVLTNWFIDSQINRLINCNIKQYFTEFYGGDDFLVKPNKEAFIRAIGKNTIEECIMVGDNLEKDIIPALNIGMKAIYVSKEKPNKNDRYITIKDISELKNIL